MSTSPMSDPWDWGESSRTQVDQLDAQTDVANSFVARMNVLASIAGSTAELARRAGVSQSGIRKYFAGGEPSRPVLISLATAVGVRLEWLVSGTGPVADEGSDLQVRAAIELAGRLRGYRRVVGQAAAPPEVIKRYLADHRGEASSRAPDWVDAVIPDVSAEVLARLLAAERPEQMAFALAGPTPSAAAATGMTASEAAAIYMALKYAAADHTRLRDLNADQVQRVYVELSSLLRRSGVLEPLDATTQRLLIAYLEVIAAKFDDAAAAV